MIDEAAVVMGREVATFGMRMNMRKKLPTITPEQATEAERLYVIGWLETNRGVYERQAARDVGAHREASEACLAVAKDAIATLRAKWNMAVGG